ncbi:hypothetical protein BG006_003775 [Podila minutissima]|uniref:DNA 3'-5' helicase n=1 Tax=Podila minutissima TaxID=64525 RepID=A0A9P5SAK4_9FUNG|nr:hypothetical protein BG006_003775 [Podila minutissima]
MASPSQAVLKTPLLSPVKDNDDIDDVGLQLFDCPEAISHCQQVFKCTPKEEQLAVMTHIVAKIDCILIAPCGWGKSLGFYLPMVFWPCRVTAIIMLLLALMADQQKKLEKANILYKNLSGSDIDIIDKDTIQRIFKGDFPAVFMTPEIVFGQGPKLMLWGSKFRLEYNRLGELRVWSPGVPFLGVTATLTDDALANTTEKLFLDEAYVIHVQEDHTNLCLKVHTQPKDAMKGLSHLLGKDKTIMYFEKISLLIDVYMYLHCKRPDLQ